MIIFYFWNIYIKYILQLKHSWNAKFVVKTQ
jgi:hypothetical protein